MKKTYLIIILSNLLLIFIVYCGKSPSDPPLHSTGAFRIAAHIDAVPVDSVFLMLDNKAKGLLPNGFIVEGVLAGKHQVAVSKKDPESPIDFSSTPKLVSVNANETTDVELSLTKFAPNFSLKNLNDEEIKLENYREKVVLLVFYSHT